MTGPRAGDVESIETIVAALYDVISGPAGPRDWDRERHLFAPGARLMPTRRLPEGGGHAVDVFDVDGYIASRTPFFAAAPFYEVEVARRVERFGNLAHVWSTYEGRREPEGEPFFRGINSVQLLDDGARWWILSILWDNERPGSPLPTKYLGGDTRKVRSAARATGSGSRETSGA